MKKFTRLWTIGFFCSVFILSGCTGAIVGGAATGAAVIHDRRTTGTVIDDQTLQWKISQEIYADKNISDNAHINVHVYNQAILLTGEAPTEELKLRTNAITAQTAPSKKIYNEVAISAPTSLLTRSNDAYISAKVKASLLSIEIKDFDLTRVSVTTENSRVYLMGLLTKAEADIVTEKVRTIPGVSHVIKLFEYIDK